MCVDRLYGACYRKSCKFTHELLPCHQYLREGNCHRILTCRYLHVRQADIDGFTSTATISPLLHVEIKRYAAAVNQKTRASGRSHHGDQLVCNKCKQPVQNSDMHVTTCNHLYCGGCRNAVIRNAECFVCRKGLESDLVRLVAP